MRILHVIYGLSDIMGDPPQGLATLARAQAARGDDVVVLPCPHTEGPQTLAVGRHGNLVVHDPPAMPLPCVGSWKHFCAANCSRRSAKLASVLSNGRTCVTRCSHGGMRGWSENARRGQRARPAAGTDAGGAER
jgi:hypothetical protein